MIYGRFYLENEVQFVSNEVVNLTVFQNCCFCDIHIKKYTTFTLIVFKPLHLKKGKISKMKLKICFEKKAKITVLMLALMPLLFTFSSCSLKKIQTEIPYKRIEKSKINSDTLGNGRILFYNHGYYCPAMTCGWTTKLNIKMNGISLGQINYGEFFIVDIEKGEYEFHLTHKDAIKINTKQKLVIDENTKVIQVIPRPLSNKITITNQIPYEFHTFNQVR